MSVSLQTHPDRIDLLVDGERFAPYLPAAPMPGFSTLLAVDCRAVMDEASTPEVSVWAACEAVNGVDFGGRCVPSGAEIAARPAPGETDALRPCGRIVSRSLVARRNPYSVGFRHLCDWIGPEGSPILTDERTIRVVPGSGTTRILDLDLTLRPPENAEAVIGRSEFGLLHIRPASQMFAAGSHIRNRAGDFLDELSGKSSEWCAAVGVVQGQTVGFAVLDHPENPGHPPVWNVGPGRTLSPSPFAWQDVRVTERRPLRLRYRILVHEDYVEHGWATARWKEYIRDAAH